MTTAQKYAIKNKERIRTMRIEWIIKNKEKLRADKKRWDTKNKEKIREYVANNRDRINATKRRYRKKYPEKTKEILRRHRQKYPKQHREYRIKNSDIIKQVRKIYRLNNAQKISQQRKAYAPRYQSKANEYQRIRRKEDPLFKLRGNIGSRITKSMKGNGYTKRSRTHEILGCDYGFFKQYIESKFTEGMSWDNSGKWHYDHIIPISSAKTEADVIRLNHYTNFQPLWAVDNIKKYNKIIEKQLVLI